MDSPDDQLATRGCALELPEFALEFSRILSIDVAWPMDAL